MSLFSSPTISLPFLGTVWASWKSPVEEESTTTNLSFDEWLETDKPSLFLLTVSTDAMREAGIHPQDIAIIERGKTPKPHDIVLAEIDNEFVLRYFQLDQGKPYLVPANPPYDILYPSSDLTVIGVLKTVVRKYF